MDLGIMNRIINIIICLLCTVELHSQNEEMKKYFRNELTFPISNYFAIHPEYSFTDTLINSIVRMDSIKSNISLTPSFFGRYSTSPNYTYKKMERVFLGNDKVLSLGYILTNTDINYYLLLEETASYLRYDLWGFSNSSGKPVTQLCLYYANKGTYIINDSEEDLEVIVDSKINEDSTIMWHSNDFGLHDYVTYKFNSDGILVKINRWMDGKYNGPEDITEDNLDDNVYYAENLNDSTIIRGEFVYNDNHDDSDKCQMDIIYKIDKKDNKRMILCGEKIVKIVDSDGYVNVRSKPDSRSKILYTIPSNKLMGIKMIENSQWAQIIKRPSDWFNNKSGYIHISRIKEVDLKNVDYSGY